MFYTSYHSDIKIAAALNILSPKIVVDIPKSTLHRFRNTDYSSLFRYEESKQFQSILELNKRLLQSERARQLFIAVLYVKDRMIAILKMGKKTKSVSRTIVVNAAVQHGTNMSNC